MLPGGFAGSQTASVKNDHHMLLITRKTIFWRSRKVAEATKNSFSQHKTSTPAEKRLSCNTYSGVNLETIICYMYIVITARQSEEPPPLLTIQGVNC